MDGPFLDLCFSVFTRFVMYRVINTYSIICYVLECGASVRFRSEDKVLEIWDKLILGRIFKSVISDLFFLTTLETPVIYLIRILT